MAAEADKAKRARVLDCILYGIVLDFDDGVVGETVCWCCFKILLGCSVRSTREGVSKVCHEVRLK